MIFISAGQFQMGSDKGRPDETPVHQVSVDAFSIDRYEVTNADYQVFVLANPQWQKSAIKVRDYLKHWDGNDFPPSMERYSVTYVTYEAAQAYCKWRGKRLPSEAEWEKAARGRTPNLLYPWGNQVDEEAANYDVRSIRSGGVKNMRRYLKSVGAFQLNGYTLYDMGGNVAEWCADSYLPHYRRRDVNRLTLPAKGPFVVRGGSWFDAIFDLRCAARAYALSGAYYHIGFRCTKCESQPIGK
jgi:formylglycine-generating enzyme required for sulfatase activity